MTEKAKILVVEDDTSVAMLMVHLLTRAGCEVATALDAAKGLELAETGNFDLITLDVDLPLPGPNGFEVCHRLKGNAHLRHMPIVFVSARPDAKHGLELGAVDYITKPFEASSFAVRIISHAKVKICPTTVLISKGATA